MRWGKVSEISTVSSGVVRLSLPSILPLTIIIDIKYHYYYYYLVKVLDIVSRHTAAVADRSISTAQTR